MDTCPRDSGMFGLDLMRRDLAAFHHGRDTWLHAYRPGAGT